MVCYLGAVFPSSLKNPSVGQMLSRQAQEKQKIMCSHDTYSIVLSISSNLARAAPLTQSAACKVASHYVTLRHITSQFRVPGLCANIFAHDSHLQEGPVEGTTIRLHSTAVARSSTARAPYVVEFMRTYTVDLEADPPTLHYTMDMATTTTPNMTRHLEAWLTKVSE